jgi:hypothetical protein
MEQSSAIIVSSPKSGLFERAGDGDADLREAGSRQIIPVIAHVQQDP